MPQQGGDLFTLYVQSIWPVDQVLHNFLRNIYVIKGQFIAQVSLGQPTCFARSRGYPYLVVAFPLLLGVELSSVEHIHRD